MNLTNTARVIKLVGDLARRPGYIPAYLRFHPFRKVVPLQAKLPWWSFEAIDYIAARLADNPKKVFEFGTGGSTIFFAERCREVISVEDDPAWLQRVAA